nr:MAG: twitching motility protein PilT [Thermoproteus sp. AZ2]
MRLVADTSSLLYLVEERLGLDPLLGHEVYVPYPVLEEIYALARRKRAARVALALLRALSPFILAEEGPADSAVLRAALRLRAFVLSGDEELLREAKRRGVGVAVFHGRELELL